MMAPAYESRRYIVRGRVQGVYFRGSAQAQAEKLGLRGWARNLPDGTVEVYAQGPAPAQLAFHEWLRRGPRMARVSAVEEVDAGDEVCTAFVVR